MNRAVFLDRDGTICEEVGYMNHLQRFRVFPWSGEAVRRINQAGWKTILITNQAGVARGYFPITLLDQVHARLNEELAREGAHLDGIYYCPHHPEAKIAAYRQNCQCRKPRPGLLLEAARDHQLDLASSWIIGDRYLDIQTGRAVGASGILVLTGYGRGEWEYGRAAWEKPPEHSAENLLQAVVWLLNRPS